MCRVSPLRLAKTFAELGAPTSASSSESRYFGGFHSWKSDSGGPFRILVGFCKYFTSPVGFGPESSASGTSKVLDRSLTESDSDRSEGKRVSFLNAKYFGGGGTSSVYMLEAAECVLLEASDGLLLENSDDALLDPGEGTRSVGVGGSGFAL